MGDEVTLAGAQQLATFRMQEDSIKKLLPVMQDMMVKEKGLNGTGEDMKGIASTFAKAMNGQTMILKRSGIVLSEREEQLMKVGTEEQKVALLTEAVRRSIGEQNKEILKTPEGKIVSAKNRIGDLYEVWGMSIRDTRAKFWEFVADNADGIQDIIGKIFKGGASFLDTFMGVFRDIKKGFNALPDGAKTGLKGLGALALAYKFPIIALALAVEDVFAAFQGKESFTEDAINALLKFTGKDYRFENLRNDINQFFEEICNPAERANEDMGEINFALQETIEFLKAGLGLLQTIISLPGVAINGIEYGWNRIFHDKETADREWNDSWSVNNMKSGWDKLTTSSEKIIVKNPERLGKTYDREIERKNKAMYDYVARDKNSSAPYVPDVYDYIGGGSPEKKQFQEALANFNKKPSEVNNFTVPKTLNIDKYKESKEKKEIESFNNPQTIKSNNLKTPKQDINYSPKFEYHNTYSGIMDMQELDKRIKDGYKEQQAYYEKDKNNLLKIYAGMGLTFGG